jgi:phage baseplate assembly protein W
MSSLAAIGRGWAFPVKVDREHHSLLYVDGPEKIRESIWIILDTEPGERIMRPTFGCGLRRYLGEPNTVAVRSLIRHDVEQSLTAWEPRISVSGVAVAPGADPSLVEIAVSYVHTRTNRPDNLVYPFVLG